MKKAIYSIFIFTSLCMLPSQPLFSWGFFAHQRINRLAIFTLPPDMIVFYKKHIRYLMENSVKPDMRRYAVVNEAPRHYIDAEAYGDSALWKMPFTWKEAIEKIGEDSLMKHGIVPYHIQGMKHQLIKAFQNKDGRNILRISAEIGHYIADANVPLHTTSNYNGQKTGQEGIHAFWESRLPELFSDEYDFFVGKAQLEEHTQLRAWRAVQQANTCLDSVLTIERNLTQQYGEARKYAIEGSNKNVKTYSRDFSGKYHQQLNSQVERQMRRSIKMIGDFWFTCWVEAGQPKLSEVSFALSDPQRKEEATEEQNWLKRLFNVRKEE
jgi:hypothetical protein